MACWEFGARDLFRSDLCLPIHSYSITFIYPVILAVLRPEVQLSTVRCQEIHHRPSRILDLGKNKLETRNTVGQNAASQPWSQRILPICTLVFANYRSMIPLHIVSQKTRVFATKHLWLFYSIQLYSVPIQSYLNFAIIVSPLLYMSYDDVIIYVWSADLCTTFFFVPLAFAFRTELPAPWAARHSSSFLRSLGHGSPWGMLHEGLGAVFGQYLDPRDSKCSNWGRIFGQQFWPIANRKGWYFGTMHGTYVHIQVQNNAKHVAGPASRTGRSVTNFVPLPKAPHAHKKPARLTINIIKIYNILWLIIQ